MDSKKLNELLRAFKSGNKEKLEEIKSMISDEDYHRAIALFNQYNFKSESDILDELYLIKKTIPHHEEIIKEIRPMLNSKQLSKLNQVMIYLNQQD